MVCKGKNTFLTVGNLIVASLICWTFFTLRIGMIQIRMHESAIVMNDNNNPTATASASLVSALRNPNISSWKLKSLERKLKLKHHFQHPNNNGASPIHTLLSTFTKTRNSTGVIHKPQSPSEVSFPMEKMTKLCQEYHIPTMNAIRGNIEGQCLLTSTSIHSNLSFGGFQIQHSRNTKSSQVQQKQPLGCVISHTYNFIYIHVLKSGGMSFKAFLKEALCGSMTLPCERGSDMLQIGRCTDALRDYPNYFVWSFTRNPYSRLYSLYAMSLTMLKPRNKPMLTPKRIRQKHTRKTLMKHLVRNKRTLVDKNERLTITPEQTDYTFENFATHSDKRSEYSYLHYGHYRPQSIFLFDDDECPLVDFIGRLEHSGQDLPFLLERLGSPELLEYARMRNWTLDHDMTTAYGKKKRDTEQTSLREYFDSNKIKMATIQEFESDFRLLGYERDVVPE